MALNQEDDSCCSYWYNYKANLSLKKITLIKIFNATEIKEI